MSSQPTSTKKDVPSRTNPPFSSTTALTSNTIKYLTTSNLSNFARLDPDWTIVECRVNPDWQNEMPHRVFLAMSILRVVDPELSYPNFLRMWKTLVLKRSQDVYEKVFCRRPDNYIRIGYNTLIPAPLDDLLSSLGSHQNPLDGVWYVTVPIARPNNPQSWWTIDPAIQNAWNRTMHAMQKFYSMREYPKPSDYENRSIFYCTTHVTGDLVSVKSHFNCIKYHDGFLTAVNDDIFDPEPFPYESNHLSMINNKNLSLIRSDYVASYILDSQ